MAFEPEILIPAGSLEKLKAASLYGASAVYLSGQKFGLRAASENFTWDELREGVSFAHARKVKTYIVLNGFLHDRDLEELPDFVKYIESLKVDGVIVSDLGVIRTVARVSSIPIHLSTQASCLNVESGKLWKESGVKRLILGREASVREAGKIKKETGLEVEIFIHGSMCMAYSGNCTISNFTQGRDSNRGGCAQSCRFDYSLEYENGEKADHSFFLSSKDLLGVRQIPQFFGEEIDSAKVEGRMRSPLYAALSAKIYREAIEAFKKSESHFYQKIEEWEEELRLVPHRDYASGSLEAAAGSDSVFSVDRRNLKRDEYLYLGSILKVKNQDYVLLEVRSQFSEGEELEWVPFQENPISFRVSHIRDVIGEATSIAKTSTLVKLPYFSGAEAGQILRKKMLA